MPDFTEQLDTDTLTRLASSVRESYCRTVRHWYAERGEDSDYGAKPIAKLDGGRDGYDRTHKAVWPVAVQFFLQHRIGADPYFQFHFKRFGPSRFPSPQQILTDKALAAFLSQRDPNKSMTDVRTRMRCDRDTFENEVSFRKGRLTIGWTATQVAASILADEGLKISPLFRFLAALRLHMSESMQSLFLYQAIQQYLSSPEEYDAVLGFKPVFRCGAPVPDDLVNCRSLEIA